MSYDYRNSGPEASHTYLYPTVSGLLRNVPKGANVLDLGCGNGSFLACFQDQGWNLAGTDFSTTGIEIAKASHPGINFFVSDVEHAQADIAAQVGEVDVIVSTEVIEHLYSPREFLKTVCAVLKPGGYFVVTTPYHGYLKNLMLAATGKLDKHFTVLWDHGHIKFWSRASLTLVLYEAGLKPLEFRGSGRTPYMWKSMVMLAQKPD